MILSPFTPLFFPRTKHDGIDSRYVQTFSPDDDLLIQMIGSKFAPAEPCIFAEPGHKRIGPVQWNRWDINNTKSLYYVVIALEPGLYTIELEGYGCSALIKSTNDADALAGTTLIQYSMNSNRHRDDAIFFIDGEQQFFDFRAPGGFKDGNWTFAVEGEQFVTDQSDIVQLYGLESTQRKFTMGNSDGCPVWFGEMLNRLLCCSYVYFDGTRYARKDTAVPEVTSLIEGVNSFVFNQSLQRIEHIKPTIDQLQAALLRRTTDQYRLAKTNILRTI